MISEEWESASRIWEELVRVDRGGIVRRAVEERKEGKECRWRALVSSLSVCSAAAHQPAPAPAQPDSQVANSGIPYRRLRRCFLRLWRSSAAHLCCGYSLTLPHCFRLPDSASSPPASGMLLRESNVQTRELSSQVAARWGVWVPDRY